MRAFLRRKTPYGVWWGLVVTACVVTWFVDPYVYAYTVMVLMIASVPVALCGMLTWITSARPRPHGVALLSMLIGFTNFVAFVLAVLANWRC